MILHVGILVVHLPHNHCGAMNWSLFRADGCSDMVFCTLPHAGKKEEITIAEETDKLL